jgi:DNA-binding NtrC family response regulator
MTSVLEAPSVSSSPLFSDSPSLEACSAGAPRRILIVEDQEEDGRNLRRLLEDEKDIGIDTAKDGETALEKLLERDYSLLITDLRMPSMDGMQLIHMIQERGLSVSVIVITGHGRLDDAIGAMRHGVYDFLTKPIDVDHLRFIVRRALQERQLKDELAALRRQLQKHHAFHGMLSKNPRMHAVFELIRNVGDTTTTVLIEGETGTGKEEVARAIHASSPRRAGPLVAVNCAALPETLLESELFGHEKGAFTGALARRPGRFELANGGTLFLDEVGDVPPTMQAKLLRVLQERRFERVGGTESIEVDVRIIAATNRPLQQLVRQQKFRKDLFYRLNVLKIDLPPLRERPEVISLLAAHFAEKFARPGEEPKRFAPEAMQVLINYRWPGNVRELENVVERVSVTSLDGVIAPESLPPSLLAPAPVKLPFAIDLDRPLPDVIHETVAALEQQYIRKALQKSRGNVSRCARICGLSRRSMTTKLAQYSIDKSTYKEAY